VLFIHICIFVENTHPNKNLGLIVGGIENQLNQLIKSYKKNPNINISLITRYSEYTSKSKRMKIYQIHKFRSSIIDTLYFFIISFFRMIKIHKNEKIDVINIHTFTYIILIPTLIGILFKIPILMKIPIDFESHIRDIYMLKKKNFKSKFINFSWIKFFKTYLIKKINFIRAINEKIYQDLINLNIPKQKIIKIPNGIDINSLKFIKKEKHLGINYGYVGRLSEFKNLNYLLVEFVKYIKIFPQDKLYIFGKGNEFQSILNFIKSRSLSKNIILKGYEKDKVKIYQKLDVIIDPAFAQGISNTILEAMCTKTFIIASNVIGNRDLIKNKKTGLLFNPFKENDLYKKLIYYKNHQEKSKEMINLAFDYVLNNHDVEKIAQRIYFELKKKIRKI